MSCNCNNADPNCEPCAFCTPPGVKCLPDCNPQDPCPEKIDLCCVLNSGPDYPCSNIENGDKLCDLLLQFLEVEFPDSECCRLEMSIDLLAESSVTTTTTSTTSTTTTTTTSGPTTTSTTSTTSTTTSTTATAGLQSVQLCAGDSCLLACACDNAEPSTYYVTSSSILQNSTIYANTSGTYASPGYYSNGTSCFHVTGSLGKVTTVTPCAPFGKIEINLEGLIGDVINNVTYNGVPIIPTSGTFPLTVSVAFMTALVSNPANLGTLRIYQNIQPGQSTTIQTTVVDANGTIFCQNPANGLINYEVYNIDINMSVTTVTIQAVGSLC
jgi:hypothetical protein